MVRIKNRYLLVNILYPQLDNKPVDINIPDVVQFNQPTTDKVSTQDLLNGIKAEVDYLFGDYGAGSITGSVIKYWSPATSTFILRVARDHYRMAWAGLSIMNHVPVKDGRSCLFRVVRVSGTIKKSQAEAMRRAREMIMKARREMGEKGDLTLDNIFGKDAVHSGASSAEGFLMVNRSDSEEDEESSDGNG